MTSHYSFLAPRPQKIEFSFLVDSYAADPVG